MISKLLVRKWLVVAPQVACYFWVVIFIFEFCKLWDLTLSANRCPSCGSIGLIPMKVTLIELFEMLKFLLGLL